MFLARFTATMFLKEFVPEKTLWVHLDIAGTAYCSANGFGVRLFAERLSQWSPENVSKK